MQEFEFLLAVCIGMVAGAVVLWLVLRRLSEAAVNQAKSESMGEIARLEERASRVPTLEAQLTTAREELAARQKELQEKASQVASLTEQTSRLPDLERQLNAGRAESQKLTEELANLREKAGGLESALAAQKGEAERLRAERAALQTSRDDLTATVEDLKTHAATLTTALDAERKQGSEKLALLNEAKEELSNRFKALANDILEEKAKRFTEQNKANISQILDPLQTKIKEFQSKVEEVYVNEGNQRSALGEQVRQLIGLNQQLSSDANNLTQALKGSSKTQGNWGELILERVLDASGLQEGRDYYLRPTYTREDGSRAQPDVVICVQENKHLVIDAKVSLTAYDVFTKSDNEADQTTALGHHLSSMRSHVQSLSAKNYQGLPGLNSVDYQIMFVPVEPAFTLAMANDVGLWEEAWRKNVLLVSPSGLLFVLRTVAYLLRQEQQQRNAQEIARRGGELYDKLVGFVEQFSQIGERLRQAQDSYDGAEKRLATGRGNVIRQAEMLRELGVKPNKALPQAIVESASEEPLLPAAAAVQDDVQPPTIESE